MSSNNNNSNDLSGIGIAAGMAGACLLLFFMVVYALLVFGAFVLSILCLFAWNHSVTLGNWTLEPDEARGFIVRGLIGAFVLPAFVIFCELLFGVRVNGAYLPHIVLGGYALGSLGIAMLAASNEAEAGHTIDHAPLPPPSAQIAPPKGFVPSQPPQTQPFRFASWDDEEERS